MCVCARVRAFYIWLGLYQPVGQNIYVHVLRNDLRTKVGREILHRVQDLWLLDRFFLAADESCPEPSAPAHGSIHCSMVNSDKVCSVVCDAGFVFSSPPSAYYTCSKNGVWTPSRSIPDCVNGRLWGWSRDIGYALAVGYFFQVNIAYFGLTPLFSHEGDTCKARSQPQRFFL